MTKMQIHQAPVSADAMRVNGAMQVILANARKLTSYRQPQLPQVATSRCELMAAAPQAWHANFSCFIGLFSEVA